MQAHVASDSPRRQKGGRGAYLPCRLHATAPLDGTASRRNPIYPAISTEPIDRGVLSKIQGRAARNVNRNASASGAAICSLAPLGLGFPQDGYVGRCLSKTWGAGSMARERKEFPPSKSKLR